MIELRLSDLLAALGNGVKACKLPPGTQIKGISCDSRSVTKGWLFFVSAGGEKFIEHAQQAGAWSAGTDQRCDLELINPEMAFRTALRLAYQMNERPLRLWGVTGTNGKTTTAFCLQHLLDNCGLLGTVRYDCGGGFERAGWTTPPEEKLFDLFDLMRANKLDKCAMELSSHALAQQRAGAFRFEAAIFTNLTGDHLDYHGDFESYFTAKRRLFFELLDESGVAVVNIDGEHGQRLNGELNYAGRKVITTGKSSQAQYPYRIISVESTGTVFELANQQWVTNLIGEYNIANLSGALLAAMFTGVPIADLIARLKKPIIVPGRLEKMTHPGQATVWIDYAHTDDAIEKAASALRGACKGRLLVVFGAGGDRDRSKRPRMGLAASRYADKIFLTSDNPRNEDPDSIIDMIESGIPSGCPCERIVDRKRAIYQAIKNAQEEDWILIAGKGHEDYQEVKSIKTHFCDAEIVREAWSV